MRTKINAEIAAHSINQQGDELISVLGTFPRIILSEVNTHRMLSKNTSSSRAIPFNKMVESVLTDPFIPIAWQKSHKGMQGSEYHTDPHTIKELNSMWEDARDGAVESAKTLINEDVTKQLANRLLEPFMWTTMLITGSREGWENFFRLRCPSYEFNIYGKGYYKVFRSKKDWGSNQDSYDTFRPDEGYFRSINTGQAEIHIMEFAECVWDVLNKSTPEKLEPGEWHIPFKGKLNDHNIAQIIKSNHPPYTELKVKISTAMAARTSYTTVGEEKEIDYRKMIELHDKLLTQDPPHSSPFEHCGRTMTNDEYESFAKGKYGTVGYGVADFDKKDQGWCNNFKGFIPYRYIIDNKLNV